MVGELDRNYHLAGLALDLLHTLVLNKLNDVQVVVHDLWIKQVANGHDVRT